MTAFVALLRGINVGGRNKVAMADLRELVSGLGHNDVTTHIQSGNVIFTGPSRASAPLESAIETAIADAMGLDITVVVRTAADLERIVDGNPFAKRHLEATKLVLVFLKTRSKKATVDVSRYGPEEVVVSGRELYIHYPNGQGRSKLTNTVLEREVGVPGTARNWNTVNKLLALTQKS